MGLWTILKKIKQKEREVRLLVVGLDNSGKTTTVKQFNGEEIDTIAPTLGFNITTLRYNNYTLNIWDIGGQKTLRSYWKNYFEETDGIVWVVDSADVSRMNACREELQKILQEERLSGASLLIMANKQDLKNAMNTDEISKVLDLGNENHYKGRHWKIVKTSAYTKEGLEEGMSWIVGEIAKRRGEAMIST